MYLPELRILGKTFTFISYYYYHYKWFFKLLKFTLDWDISVQHPLPLPLSLPLPSLTELSRQWTGLGWACIGMCGCGQTNFHYQPVWPASRQWQHRDTKTESQAMVTQEKQNITPPTFTNSFWVNQVFI